MDNPFRIHQTYIRLFKPVNLNELYVFIINNLWSLYWNIFRRFDRNNFM